MEIGCRRAYLSADLFAEATYTVDSDRWLNLHGIEKDPMRKARDSSKTGTTHSARHRGLHTLLRFDEDDSRPLLRLPRMTKRSPTTMRRLRTTATTSSAASSTSGKRSWRRDESSSCRRR
jgi:hypothetical protein